MAHAQAPNFDAVAWRPLDCGVGDPAGDETPAPVDLVGDAAHLAAFFAYDTSVGLDVPAGTSDSTSFVLDLAGLDGQATGLMPGSVKLLDAGRHEIASQSIVTDVRGSLWSCTAYSASPSPG